LLFVFTFALAGCDLFGGTTTTTTTAATSDTTDTTTTITTETSGTTTTTITTTTSGTSTTTTTTTVNTGTTTTTQTLTTTTSSGTTTTTTTDGELFVRQDLIDYIIAKAGDTTPTTEEIEAKIAFYKAILGITSEQDLYYLLLASDTLMDEFNLVETLTDFQALYQNAKTLGFDKTFVTNVMTNAALQFVNESADNFDETFYTSLIAEMQADIVANEFSMMQIRSGMTDYCNNSTGYGVECIGYYDAYINEYQLNTVFSQAQDEAENNPAFDISTYLDLIWNLDDVIQYTYYNVDTYYQELYQDSFDTLYGALSPEEKTLYDNVLEKYELYATVMYRDRLPKQDFLYGVTDYNSNPIAQIVYSDYYSYYENLGNLNQQIRFELQESQDELVRMQEQHQMMILMQTYFGSVAGQAKLKTLMITIYDILDSVILGVSQESFDLLLGILSSETDFSFEDLTAEEIALYSGQIADLMTLIKSTITTEDTDNLKALVKEFAAIYVGSLDLTLLEQTALIVKLNAAVDHYVDVFFETYDDLIVFLDSITLQKASIILDVVAMMKSEDATMEERIIGIATLIDTLQSDGSLDINSLTHNLTELYYDIQTMFNPDLLIVSDVNDAIDENIARILELSAIIKEYDSSTILDAEDMLNLEELLARVQAFAMMFEYGFESILDPIAFGYEHQDFIDLIYRLSDEWMTLEEAEAQLLMYMDVFGYESEEETYYLLSTIMIFANELRMISSFTDFQNWFYQVIYLGFSNEAIAEYILNFIILKVDDINTNSIIDKLAAVNDRIDEYTGYIEFYSDELDSINAEVLMGIAMLDPSYQATATAFWEAAMQRVILEIEANTAYWNAMDTLGYYTVLRLIDARDMVVFYESILDFENAAFSQDAYDTLYNSLEPEEQDLIDDMFSAENALLLYETDTYNPLYLQCESLEYFNVTIMFTEFEYTYFSCYQNMIDYSSFLEGYVAELAQIEADQASLLLLQTYLQDLDNQQLIQDVIVIVIEEVTQLILASDPQTFDVFFGFLMNTTVKVYGLIGEEPETPDIDLSPEAILGYSEDISALLHLIFSTMSLEDIVKVKALLLDAIEIQLTMEGKTGPEIEAFMTVITPEIDKYWVMLTGLIEVMYHTLDGLTEAKIQIVIDNLTIIMDDMSSLPSKVIAGSAIIDALCTDGTFDYETIIDSVLTVYFDVMYEFDYSLTDLEDLQTIYKDQIAAIIALASEIKDYDVENLTELQLQSIFEAQKRVMYLISVVQNPESITDTYVFVYEHTDFVNLIYSMYGDELTPTEVEDEISSLMASFDATEEFTYYRITLIGYLMQGVSKIETLSDFKTLVQSILNSGVSIADLSEYAVNTLVDMFWQNLDKNPVYFDYQSLLDNLAGYVASLDASEIELAQIDSEVDLEISGIINIVAQELAEAVWLQGLDLNELNRAWDNFYYEGSDSDLWSGSIYNELMIYRYGIGETPIDLEAYDLLWSSLSVEQQVLYAPVFDASDDYFAALEIYEGLLEDLVAYALTTSDEVTEFSDYLDAMRIDRYFVQNDVIRLTRNVQFFEIEVAMAQAELGMILIVADYLSNPDNIGLSKEVLVIVFDEFANFIMNADEETLNFFASVFFNFEGNPEEEINALFILTKLQAISDMLDLFYATFTPEEMDTLTLFLDQVMGSYIRNCELDFSDSEEIALILSMNIIIEDYFQNILALVPIFNSFLDSLTLEKIQIVMDQTALLNLLPTEDDNADNLVRLQAISNILVALLGDGSLDTDAIIDTLIGLIYDVEIAIGNDEFTAANRILAFQTALDALMLQANVVYLYDFTSLTVEQLIQVDLFKGCIDSLQELVVYLPIQLPA